MTVPSHMTFGWGARIVVVTGAPVYSAIYEEQPWKAAFSTSIMVTWRGYAAVSNAAFSNTPITWIWCSAKLLKVGVLWPVCVRALTSLILGLQTWNCTCRAPTTAPFWLTNRRPWLCPQLITNWGRNWSLNLSICVTKQWSLCPLSWILSLTVTWLII